MKWHQSEEELCSTLVGAWQAVLAALQDDERSSSKKEAAELRVAVLIPEFTDKLEADGNRAIRWARQAQAIARWIDWRSGLKRGSFLLTGGWHPLAGRCDSLANRMAGRNRWAKVAQWVLPGTTEDEALLAEAQDVLERCREALRPRLLELVRVVDDFLSQAPRDWPPLFAARLARKLHAQFLEQLEQVVTRSAGGETVLAAQSFAHAIDTSLRRFGANPAVSDETRQWRQWGLGLGTDVEGEVPLGIAEAIVDALRNFLIESTSDLNRLVALGAIEGGLGFVERVRAQFDQGPADAMPLALHLLNQVYHWWRNEKCTEAIDLWRSVVARLYYCLSEDAALELFPRLNDMTLLPLPLSEEPPQRCELEWDEHDPNEAATPCRWQFANAWPQKIILSTGTEALADVKLWWNLPPLPSSRNLHPDGTRPTTRIESLLTDVRGTASRWLWRRERLQSEFDRLAAEFRQERDQAGWHYLCALFSGALALNPGNEKIASECRKWTGVLLESGWCRPLFPDIDLERWQTIWPRDASMRGAKVQWQFCNDRPIGECIRLKQFGSTPGDAECCISLGPIQEHLAAVLDMEAAAELVPAELSEQVARLAAATRDDVRLRRESPASDLVVPVLDALASMYTLPLTDNLNSLMVSLTRWCHHFNLQIYPETTNRTEDEIRRVLDNPVEKDYIEVIFDPQCPARHLLRVEQYGLKRCNDGTLVRPWKLVVSAGPSPSGFAELRQALVNGGETITSLLVLLDQWPTKVLQEQKAVTLAERFFIKYWDDCRPGLDNGASELASKLDEKVKHLLAGLDRLVEFPMELDRQGRWKAAPKPARAPATQTFGVLRPLLKDKKGEVHVPPRVWYESDR